MHASAGEPENCGVSLAILIGSCGWPGPRCLVWMPLQCALRPTAPQPAPPMPMICCLLLATDTTSLYTGPGLHVWPAHGERHPVSQVSLPYLVPTMNTSISPQSLLTLCQGYNVKAQLAQLLSQLSFVPLLSPTPAALGCSQAFSHLQIGGHKPRYCVPQGSFTPNDSWFWLWGLSVDESIRHGCTKEGCSVSWCLPIIQTFFVWFRLCYTANRFITITTGCSCNSKQYHRIWSAMSAF